MKITQLKLTFIRLVLFYMNYRLTKFSEIKKILIILISEPSFYIYKTRKNPYHELKMEDMNAGFFFFVLFLF